MPTVKHTFVNRLNSNIKHVLIPYRGGSISNSPDNMICDFGFMSWCNALVILTKNNNKTNLIATHNTFVVPYSYWVDNPPLITESNEKTIKQEITNSSKFLQNELQKADKIIDCTILYKKFDPTQDEEAFSKEEVKKMGFSDSIDKDIDQILIKDGVNTKLQCEGSKAALHLTKLTLEKSGFFKRNDTPNNFTDLKTKNFTEDDLLISYMESKKELIISHDFNELVQKLENHNAKQI